MNDEISIKTLENRISKAISQKDNLELTKLVLHHPIYTAWIQYILGVSAYSSGMLLSNIKFNKIEKLSQVYSYVGLKGKTKSYNRELYKVCMNIADKLLAIGSPYTVYYYLHLVKYQNYYEDQNLMKHNAKIHMIKAFLKDLVLVYRTYFGLPELQDSTLEFSEEIAFNKELNKVDYTDFLHVTDIQSAEKRNWLKNINDKYSINVLKIKSKLVS